MPLAFGAAGQSPGPGAPAGWLPCQLAAFALGGLATALVVCWQCVPIADGTVRQEDLHRQWHLQAAEQRLFREVRQRLQGLEWRRQLLNLQKQPGQRRTPLEARLGALFCEAARGGAPSGRPPLRAGGRGAPLPEPPRPPPRADAASLLQRIADGVERLEGLGTSPRAPCGTEDEHYMGGRRGGAAAPRSGPGRPWRRRLQPQRVRRPHGERPLQRRWAFVTMAHDPPGGPAVHLLSVLPIARALQRLSSYPLVVLTNQTTFQDGTSVSEGLRRLNALVRPLRRVEMPERLARRSMPPSWHVAFWKLQIWALTEFERLIWLDADAVVFRGLDWLFQRERMHAQRDDWFCLLNRTRACSGLMLVFPSLADFRGLLAYAEGLEELPRGDQQLISEYFAARGRPLQLLSDLEAGFGQCAGRAPAPYLAPNGRAVPGAWSLPGFLHKSGGWGDTDDNAYNNVCFSGEASRQRYRVGAAELNACQLHPLGPYWRDLFCGAAARLGLRLPEAGRFCDDRCWYRGLGPAGACGPLAAALGGEAYYEGRRGRPAPEAHGLLV